MKIHQTCFEDYSIPVFIDKRRSSQISILYRVDLLGDERGNERFPAGEIFAYLKNRPACVKRDEINLLENYCLALVLPPTTGKAISPAYAARSAEQFDERVTESVKSNRSVV